MKLLTRFMNWARGESYQPTFLEEDFDALTSDYTDNTLSPHHTTIPDFHNWSKKQTVDWIKERFGYKLSMRNKKEDIIKKALKITSENYTKL